ncbi:MAG: hypothetical protein P4L49_19875 [Desulfosporosinus sp.]|nr:hypothetical protein [Desulfosporosinus sp.]
MKFKTIAGTLSIIALLSTPTLAQAYVAADKSLGLLTGQSEIVALRAKALGIDATGLTDDEISRQLKVVGQVKQIANLQARAKALNIDIAGLTNDQARIKIKAVDRKNTLTNILAQAETLGIGIDIIEKS